MDHPTEPAIDVPPQQRIAFPVVGIGASAGGFAALAALLRNMPPAPGMALVVVLHLSPNERSTADKVLQGATGMPVVQIAHATPVLPDHVYVIPPGRCLRMCGGELLLGELQRSRGHPAAIDIFLRSLAEAHREQAVGVILSGMGTDGTAGLAHIKAMGGVTIAQTPAEAEEAAMPRTAIASGMADFVLPAAAIPRKLAELRDNGALIRRNSLAEASLASAPSFDPDSRTRPALDQVLTILYRRTGHDFTHYRRPTLLRGIERRLHVRAVPDLDAYRRLLEQDRTEAGALMKDLLIGVTSFFRDRAMFDMLDQAVLRELLDEAHGQAPLRVWVAACSSGEEAYSLAMLFADHLGGASAPARRELQMFASDVDGHAIETARRGLYPASITEQVPAARLAHYFTREGDHYKIRKALRRHILFTQHDLLQQAAFSQLDLISCRNFMIYLNQDMHRRLLRQLHFALRPGGYLVLGSAESADIAADLFVPVDAALRIYRARGGSRMADTAAPAPARSPRPAPDLAPPAPDAARARLFSFADIHQAKATELGPPSILVNGDGDIVHVSERAAAFLRPAGGEPTRELVRLVAPELQLGLRAALFQARKRGLPASTGPVRFRYLDAEQSDAEQSVDLLLVPFRDQHAEDELMLVQFRDAQALPPAIEPERTQADSALVRQLDEELSQVRRQLHDTIEQAESSIGGMRIYIEEMQTTIEELRAGAFELDRSRDLLRSANQELQAANQELQRRAEEAAKAHDDLSNLVASSDVATIFLDRAMCILRYTPRIADFFNVIPADIGRSLYDISTKLDAPQLADEAARVFDTLQAMEREVRASDGRHYIVRVHPYRTNEHRIEGAVMSFFDISSRRAAEKALRASEERFRLFVTASVDTVYKMSAAWKQMTVLEGMDFLADTPGPSRTWLARYIPVHEQARVSEAIDRAIRDKAMFELEHQVIRSDGGAGWTSSRAVPLLDEHGDIIEWFGAATDISRRKELEQARQDSEARLSAVFESLPAAVGVYDSQGRVILANHAMQAYLPSGMIPSRDPAGAGRWRAWDAEGRLLDLHDYPGARALRGERVVPGVEMLLRQDDGSERWACVSTSPVLGINGEILGHAAVIADIDVLKRTGAGQPDRSGHT